MAAIYTDNTGFDRQAVSEKASPAMLRSRVEGLVSDSSYSAAEELRTMLHGLSASPAERKELMHQMFTPREIERMTGKLEERLQEASQSRIGYEQYMKGVHERLQRFSGIFSRDSWGFAYGVDHEDLMDERNEQRCTGERNQAVNAALMQLKAIYGTAQFGQPYGGPESDPYEKRIDRIVSTGSPD